MVERNDGARSLLDVLERVVDQGVTLVREALDRRRAIRILGSRLVVVEDQDALNGGGLDPRPPAPRAGG